jgi:hypothetical protein
MNRGGAFLHSEGSISAQSYFDEGDYTIRVAVYGQRPDDEPVRGDLRVGQPDFRAFRPNIPAAGPTSPPFGPTTQAARRNSGVPDQHPSAEEFA